MKWWIKNSEVAGLDCWFDTYKDAVACLRGRCGEGYYLDVEFSDTEEFVKWMNDEFLDPHDHGYYCKIHKMNNERYWQEYLRPLGMDIAWGIATGVEIGEFRKTDTWVQYIEDDCKFITFDSKEQFFNECWPLDDIIYEMSCRG